MIRITVIFVFIGAALGQTHHGNGHDHVAQTNGQTTQNPDDILCPYFLSLDCDDHINDPNYRVCGSDGITYTSNCRFLQKSCLLHSLEVVHHGTCNLSTTTPVTDLTFGSITKSTTMKTLTTGASAATSSPIGSSTLFLSALPYTTTVAITTTPSIVEVIQSVFCDNKDNIRCDHPPNLTCGSNGVAYPNECEFYKAVCDDSSLVQADVSTCGTHSLRLR